MGIFNYKYPYTDFHEMNLDWIISEIRRVEHDWSEFKILNTIHFEGDWDITKQYQAWSLVNDDNKGYISVQPVPVGLDITNIDYWKPVADYNELIPDIESRIIALEGDVTLINGDITNIQGDINTLNNTTIPAIEDEIDQISATLQNVLTRNIIIIGDSYLEDMNTSASGDYDAVRVMIDALADDARINIENHSEGGCGFAVATVSKKFASKIGSIVTAFEPSEVTDIFLVGGYNDRSETFSDISDGINAAKTAAASRFPNAVISIGHIGWSATLSDDDRSAIVNNSLKSYIMGSMEAGLPYMTNIEFTMHDYNLFYTDNVHPDGDGSKELAKQLIEYIYTGSCNVYYPYKTITITSPAGVTTPSYTLGCTLHNDITQIMIPSGTFDFSPYKTIPTNAYAQLLQVTTTTKGNKLYAISNFGDANHIKPILNLKGYFTRVSGGTTFYDCTNIAYILKNGFIHARSYAINNSRNGFESLDSIKAIALSGNAFTIPTLYC